MSNDPRKNRFPKVLRDQLYFVLKCIRKIDPELELLGRYRRNQGRHIADNGANVITNRTPVMPNNLEHIPFEHLNDIARIDKTFQAVHRYRDGGAEDYMAEDVYKLAQRLHAEGPRKTSVDPVEIAAFLEKRGYASSNDKRSLIGQACEYFIISESTVRRAAKKAGLTRK